MDGKNQRPWGDGREEQSRRPLGGRPALLLVLMCLNPPLLSAQGLVNSLDTTSCCFHLAFLFPLNNLLPPTDLNFLLIYPRTGMGHPARAGANLHTQSRKVQPGCKHKSTL